jgi:hypothetical protein
VPKNGLVDVRIKNFADTDERDVVRIDKLVIDRYKCRYSVFGKQASSRQVNNNDWVNRV